MQGVHVFERHAKTVIDLESFVERDHLLRKIDRVLDTAFVRDSTAACYADGLGRPSVDPEVYFRMELVAYLYGISSERQLCEDVYYNLPGDGARPNPNLLPEDSCAVCHYRRLDPQSGESALLRWAPRRSVLRRV